MILYINACVRKESRTNRIATALLKKLGERYCEVKLAEEKLQPLSAEKLTKRTKLAERGDFSDGMFDLAKQFAEADTIVISAPFWDLSFPSILKVYLENVYVVGIVSEFRDGAPHGLCKAKKLYYVTTAGGQFVPDFSYDYVRSLATRHFGIEETALVSAEMLDVQGYDAAKIVQQTIDAL